MFQNAFLFPVSPPLSLALIHQSLNAGTYSLIFTKRMNLLASLITPELVARVLAAVSDVGHRGPPGLQLQPIFDNFSSNLHKLVF